MDIKFDGRLHAIQKSNLFKTEKKEVQKKLLTKSKLPKIKGIKKVIIPDKQKKKQLQK